MNQPTREEFEEFKQEIREEVKQIREQRTEEIKVTRIEVASEDVLKRLESMDTKLDSVQEDTNILKIEMSGARADISNVKATQSDHSAFLIEHGQHLKAIKDDQDTHTGTLGQLISLSEGHTTRFDRIETQLESTATKDDIAGIKATQEQILKLLQQKG